MEMKTWERWTQKTKQFPKSKYGFSQHLKKVGDFVETYPMEYADYIRIKDAAKFWAYTHGKRVAVRSTRQGDGLRTVRVQLISRTRSRDDY
jgi:hypothetical protein